MLNSRLLKAGPKMTQLALNLSWSVYSNDYEDVYSSDYENDNHEAHDNQVSFENADYETRTRRWLRYLADS